MIPKLAQDRDKKMLDRPSRPCENAHMNKKTLTRNEQIFVAVLEGKTFKAVGVEHRISIERVRQIIKNQARLICYKLMLGADHLPKDDGHNWRETSQLRKHKDFWMRQLVKLGEETNHDHAA